MSRWFLNLLYVLGHISSAVSLQPETSVLCRDLLRTAMKMRPWTITAIDMTKENASAGWMYLVQGSSVL